MLTWRLWASMIWCRDSRLWRKIMSRSSVKISSSKVTSSDGRKRTVRVRRRWQAAISLSSRDTVTRCNSLPSANMTSLRPNCKLWKSISMKVAPNLKHCWSVWRLFWRVPISPLQRSERRPSTLVDSSAQLKMVVSANMMQRNLPSTFSIKRYKKRPKSKSSHKRTLL